MTDYFIGTAMRFALLGAIPVIFGFASSWSEELDFILYLFGLPAAILLLLIYAGFSFARGIKLARIMQPSWKQTPWKKAAVVSAAPLLLICTSALASPLLAAGSFGGTLSRLFVKQGHYEAIIAKARSERKLVRFGKDRDVTYKVDVGPPVRVALDPAGILDNWSGIIYDPTGEVMLARGFDPNTGRLSAPDRIKELFEGDLVGCRHLWGDYYDCSFT